MSSPLHFIANLITIIAIAIITSLGIIYPATAITQDVQLTTTTGYLIETTFSYDKGQNPLVIREQGAGKTNVLDSLQVKFYKPSGELIASYDNIVNGVVTGTYFEFNFDPATQQLSGNLDLGGEVSGEMYLKGGLTQGLSLIEVDATGEEKIIDRIN